MRELERKPDFIFQKSSSLRKQGENQSSLITIAGFPLRNSGFLRRKVKKKFVMGTVDNSLRVGFSFLFFQSIQKVPTELMIDTS